MCVFHSLNRPEPLSGEARNLSGSQDLSIMMIFDRLDASSTRYANKPLFVGATKACFDDKSRRRDPSTVETLRTDHQSWGTATKTKMWELER